MRFELGICFEDLGSYGSLHWGFHLGLCTRCESELWWWLTRELCKRDRMSLLFLEHVAQVGQWPQWWLVCLLVMIRRLVVGILVVFMVNKNNIFSEVPQLEHDAKSRYNRETWIDLQNLECFNHESTTAQRHEIEYVYKRIMSDQSSHVDLTGLMTLPGRAVLISWRLWLYLNGPCR